MKKQVSTNENINRLIEFRQALYAHVFPARRDALFETLDALLAGGTFASFAYLSQSERFRRRWPSLYQAVEDGRIDSEAFRRLVAAQLPRNGVCVFPLDSSAWPRPRSRVLQDTQYVYQASNAVNDGTVDNRVSVLSAGMVCRSAFGLVAAGGCAADFQPRNGTSGGCGANP